MSASSLQGGHNNVGDRLREKKQFNAHAHWSPLTMITDVTKQNAERKRDRMKETRETEISAAV